MEKVKKLSEMHNETNARHRPEAGPISVVIMEGGEKRMKIKCICAYIVLASSIFSFAGCSLWGPSSKGDAQFDRTAVEGQPKSLAGVYQDVGSDGSIKPHPQAVGEGGRIDGLVILGGPADMPNIKTGKNEIKGTADQTPKIRMGDTIFSPKSERRNSPDNAEK